MAVRSAKDVLRELDKPVVKPVERPTVWSTEWEDDETRPKQAGPVRPGETGVKLTGERPRSAEDEATGRRTGFYQKPGAQEGKD